MQLLGAKVVGNWGYNPVVYRTIPLNGDLLTRKAFIDLNDNGIDIGYSYGLIWDSSGIMMDDYVTLCTFYH